MTKAFATPKLTGAIAALVLSLAAAPAAAQVVFLSTQLRPIESAQKLRSDILKDFPGRGGVRHRAAAAARRPSLMGALHGELQPLAPTASLDAIDDVAAKLGASGIPAGLMELGKLGTSTQQYIPWMQATYVLVVRKEALPFLPAGADVNALTYEQLAAWGKAIQDKTGQRRIGFPGRSQRPVRPLLPGQSRALLYRRRW
jgi:multiple sugar transport system substrate-binding protein